MATPKPQPIPVEATPIQEPSNLPAAPGFENRSQLAELHTKDAGMLAAVAREEGEIKAAVALARIYPRNEAEAHRRIMLAAQRPRLAEEALYDYERGGQSINGPSVILARTIATAWGNMRSGHRVISMDDDYVHVKGYAFDLETNNYKEEESKFKKLIFRKKGGWIQPDERELRELINKHGAVCERNAILRAVPWDLADEAIEIVKETRIKAAKGELQQSRPDAIRRLLGAFERVGVSKDMLEKKLGHPLETINESELAQMRGIWKSIDDGNSRKDEHFDVPAKPAAAEKGEIDPANLAAKPNTEPKPSSEKK